MKPALSWKWGEKMDQANNNVEIGQEIPIITRVVKMPDNTDNLNPVHSDEYARNLGLRGALVGGSTLLSFMLEMMLGHFGHNWLTHGKIKVSYIGGGAIEGDVLKVHALVKDIKEEDRSRRVFLELWLENQMQEKILVGEASCLE